MPEKAKGIIFDIQRFSVHDGPGIRTTVFLKGCPLDCGWCHNPEGKSFTPQIMLNDEKCIACMQCVAVCGRGVHAVKEDKRVFYADRCNACGQCVGICPSKALTLVGREATAPTVLDEVERDRPFFDGDGGVTFSGGEAFSQAEFLLALLKEAKCRGLNTAVDTSGYTDWMNIEAALPYTDLFLYDIKAFSSELHTELTGVDNTVIKENLCMLDRHGARVWIRLPLIRGKNDAVEEIRHTAQFLSTLTCVEKIEALPYHVLGRTKNIMLGYGAQREYHAPDADTLAACKQVFHEYGLNLII